MAVHGPHLPLRQRFATLKSMGNEQAATTAHIRLEATVTGHVQGVGFRYWTRSGAEQLGLVGSAINRPDGSVGIVAEGPASAIEILLEELRSGSSPGRVDLVDHRFVQPVGEAAGFSVG
jgi:acylphosphatase